VKDYKHQEKIEEEKVWLTQVVAQAQLHHFYGKLTVIIQDGHILNVLKEESLKPIRRSEVPAQKI
jgi:hypothetical protein